jgi:hypothetical protein
MGHLSAGEFPSISRHFGAAARGPLQFPQRMSDLFTSLWQFVLVTLIPLLGLVLTTALLVYGVYARWIDIPHKWLLTRRTVQVLLAVALLCNAWVGLRLYLSHSAQQAWRDSAAVRLGRERFVLPQDYVYGELTIPAGSLINRKDPFDKGEPARPLALLGLETVRFSRPVQVAGVWASALQTVPMRVELAQDQRIGPLYRFDSASQSWVPNTLVPALACKKGQIALFQVPHIAYDIQAELGKPAPDGPQARFLPSQRLFRNCEIGPAIALEPAHGTVAATAAP